MPHGHRYTREELATAVASAHSWRGVLRALGRPGTSAGVQRAVRRQVEEFGIDHSHFTGQRRWSDGQLAHAVADARSWLDVLHELRLTDGGHNLRAVRAHAARLGLDISHLQRVRAAPDKQSFNEPDPAHLRTAGATLAAAWFMLRGYEILWPLEPCRYDLAARIDGSFWRVQVKTATSRSSGTYVARVANSRPGGHLIYDVDEIDSYFIIDAELSAYLIPYEVVSGYQQLYLRHYRNYLVAERGHWLQPPSAA